MKFIALFLENCSLIDIKIKHFDLSDVVYRISKICHNILHLGTHLISAKLIFMT